MAARVQQRLTAGKSFFPAPRGHPAKLAIILTGGSSPPPPECKSGRLLGTLGWFADLAFDVKRSKWSLFGQNPLAYTFAQ